MPIVTKVINIFEKFQHYCVQNINKHLLSYLPNLKINISCDIKSMLASTEDILIVFGQYSPWYQFLRICLAIWREGTYRGGGKVASLQGGRGKYLL